MRNTALLAMLAGFAAQRAFAQGPSLRAGFSQPAQSAAGRWEPLFQQAQVRPNQWKKGMIRGAEIGGAIGVVLYVLFQGLEVRNRLMIIVAPAAVGALIGGMIGSSSPK